MANREDNLAKNTLLFALGNFGSKLLQIILVPFYTRFMTDAQYGTVDLLQAVVSLLVPIASLTIYESVFRYAMEKEYDKTAVLSVGMVVTTLSAVVLCLGGGVASFIAPAAFVWLVVANTVTNALRTLVSQYTRAIGRSGLFALDNVLMTGLVLVLNILFIAVFGMGITGYMLGYTLANMLSAVFLMLCLRDKCRIDLKRVRKNLVGEMLVFSLPLIPNTICWWVSSFLDRVMIVSMVSTGANGLYAAAHKIPSLLSVVMTIFFQAWQVSANEEFKKRDIAQFYAKIFDQMSACIFVLGSVLIVLSRPINTVFLGADYYDAWQYMPPLVLSTVFFSFAQFLGSIYTANKKTKMAFVTNSIAVVVSVTLNAVLIPLMGVIGACVANATSYLVLWLVRVLDTKKIVPITYRVGHVAAASILLTLQMVLVCMDVSPVLTYVAGAAGTVALVALYWNNLIATAKFALHFAGKIMHIGRR